MDLPLEVRVIVYDLLPPSKLSSLLNFAGVGVYHTSVELTLPLGPTDSDPTAHEWAFGGHDSPNVSGVFSIPAGSAPQRMPGLRLYTTIDMGPAFGRDWRALNDASTDRPRKLRKQSSKSSLIGRDDMGRPYEGFRDQASSASLATSLDPDSNYHDEPCKDDNGDNGEDADDDDGGRSDGTEYMNASQRRAWRILQDMKRDPSWNGTKYDLLKRNCNSFTEELVKNLTGRTPPHWINRAAFIATSFPCIVPAGLIDETEETVPTADEPASPSITIGDPAHLTSDSGGIKIEPPRADRMDLGRSREN
ncbi:hypothetical protein JCM11491_005464 [Sporobolomyces phaffii]